MKKVCVALMLAICPTLWAAESEYCIPLKVKGQDISLPFCVRVSMPEIGGWRIQSKAALAEAGASQLLDAKFGGGTTGDAIPEGVKKEDGSVVFPSTSGSLTLKAGVMELRDVKGVLKASMQFRLLDADGGLIVENSLQDNAEKLFGTGERYNQVDQRGKKVSIWSEGEWCQTEGNSSVPIPFVLSSAGYALFQNRFEHCIIDLDSQKKGTWSLQVDDGKLDLYLFCEADPKQSLKKLAQLSGFAPMPAPWAFGIHICRHLSTGDFADSKSVKVVMDAMDKAELPYDGLILEGWDVRDPETWPDLKKAVDMLHAAGKKAMVYEASGRLTYDHWCLRGREYYEKAHGAKDAYFVAMKKGGLIMHDSHADNPKEVARYKTSKYVDFTNPEAVKWWEDQVWGTMLKDIGVDGCKIDFPEHFPEAFEVVFADGRPTAGAHHRRPVEYNTYMYKLFNEHRPDGGLCLSRGGGIGAQRYPFMWTGDHRRSWDFLKVILNGTLSSGLSGLPFMTHDLAGYVPAKDKEANIEKDVFLRGAQMACFSPMMQTHGVVTHPYQFDRHVVDVYRNYCNVHNLLRPYLIECAKEATTEGVPPVRHLFLEFPEDAEAAKIENQYMLGRELLVAPQLDKTNKRDIYLPAGSWKNLSTEDVFTGPELLKDVATPMECINVFVRSDATSKALLPVLGEVSDLIHVPIQRNF